MHAHLPKLSDHYFFPFFLLPLPGPWSVSWCLSCWISSSCSASREFMLQYLSFLTDLGKQDARFSIFISPCQVFAHDTKLCLVAGCSGCSLLSQPPLLPLQSANKDGLLSKKVSASPGALLLHLLSLPPPVQQPGRGRLQLQAQGHSLAVCQKAATNLDLCCNISLFRISNNVPVLQSCSPRRFSAPLLLQS